MSTQKHITGIILSGGKSSRMGSDKALLTINNSTFIERVIGVMKPFVDDILIISDKPDHDKFNIRREEDFIKDSGPLGGLLTGLYRSKNQDVLVLSCDIPLISEDIIITLINNADEDAEVNLIKSKGKTMPLIALYKKSCWYKIYKLLMNDERRVRVALNSLKTNAIKIDDMQDELVQNINTKDEFKALKTCK